MSPGTLPLVVISVVSWNTAARTLECLASLQALTYPNVRIVVVDNASRDDSVARIAAAYPEVCIVQSPDNCGFADGHALACHQAQAWDAAAIWMINSDATVEAHSLTHLVTAWQQHGDGIYGGVPLLRREDGTVLLNFPAKYLDPAGTPRAFLRDADVEFTPDWQERSCLPVGAVAGSCFFLPLQLVHVHGWLDPCWFLYCEEIDYCYRLRARGVTSYLEPRSRIWHGGGGSHQAMPGVENCVHYYRARNEIVLTRRHAGRLRAWLVAAKKLARATSAWRSNPQRAQLILAGVRDALQNRMGKTHAPEDFLGP